jgi:hypothetical protein
VEGAKWEPGVVYKVTLAHGGFAATGDNCKLFEGDSSFKFATVTNDILIENEIREVQNAMISIENEQFVKLEAFLKAVDHALVVQKLDEKVKMSCYERPETRDKMAYLALSEIERIEKDLKEAFGEDFDLEKLLEGNK